MKIDIKPTHIAMLVCGAVLDRMFISHMTADQIISVAVQVFAAYIVLVILIGEPHE